MQPSTTSVCNDSIKSIPWEFSNWPDNQTLYGNPLGSESVAVQDPSHTNHLEDFPALGFSDKLEAIQSISLNNTDQSMAISPSNGRQMRRAWGVFLPLAIDLIKCSAAQSSSPSLDGFQSDSDPEQRKYCRNDEEYLPSNPISIRCQKIPNPPPSISTRASPSRSTPPRPPKRPKTDRRTHSSAPSRNKQATSDQVEDIRVKLSLCRANRDRLKDFHCPVIGCQYKQLNGRMPDFRRHIRTHIRKDGEIRCKGVPWQDFVRHRHRFPKVSMDQQPYAVPDEDGLWIGGCLKTFSRADALKRHLRNTSCAGLNNRPR